MSELLNISSKKKDEIPTIIKVIGVGGGGGNAVNYMYGQDVDHVSYLLCNTDRQHLLECNVPDTIVLGQKTTKGLGAGNRPEVAQSAAQESADEIREALNDGTEMVFITAGMGGGTGTGAAPVIARIAKDMGKLTVGVVTIPFVFEGRVKILQAIQGVEELAKNVDALLVIKNELLYRVYPDLTITEAFKKADDVVTTSTRAIAEMITIKGAINLDFADVRTTLQNGGVSIITMGFASEEEGVSVAMDRALKSPLVNTTNFDKASRVLLLLTFLKGHDPKAAIAQDFQRELEKIQNNYSLIWGISEREDMENEIGVTLLASGFSEGDLRYDEYGKELSDAISKEIGETAEKRHENDRKISLFYGDVLDTGPYATVIFSEDELDNDDFISAVLATPTLKRKDEDLKKLRQHLRTSGGTEGKPIPATTRREPVAGVDDLGSLESHAPESTPVTPEVPTAEEEPVISPAPETQESLPDDEEQEEIIRFGND